MSRHKINNYMNGGRESNEVMHSVFRMVSSNSYSRVELRDFERRMVMNINNEEGNGVIERMKSGVASEDSSCVSW